MRGKGQPNTRSSVTSGITPAYAGKSRKFSRPVWVTGDHPRLCGEKPKPDHNKQIQARITPAYAGKSEIDYGSELSNLGSPPPMRGKVRLLYHRGEFFRITPAYAGKRETLSCAAGLREDHPRLCGEKSRYSVTLWITAGSPPPMRGKVINHDRFLFAGGITPAYAGKSPSGQDRRHISQDHPRLCGEKSTPPATGAGRRGSPPPMRGKDAPRIDSKAF